ncbi:MAG: hypothetical protein KIT09_03320 [Bryobacteraceae bacterium]|nr:hypothetical protein [Bryobacteraceae bacterium]
MAQNRNGFLPVRLLGVAIMFLGALGSWYNWRLVATEGRFLIKLCVFAPLAISGGLLILLRPEWARPLGKDSSRGHKMALIAVIAFMAAGSGMELFRLQRYRSELTPRPKVIAWSPSMGKPPIPSALASRAGPPSLTFLGRQYRLGSFHQASNPEWGFVTGAETADDWTTRLTIVDRADVRTPEDLDRLAESMASAWQSRGGRIVTVKTMGQAPATPFQYAVVAFDQPAEHRRELHFAKMALVSGNGVVVTYGVRLADPQDYRAKADRFLDANSVTIGRELENLVLPEVSTLPKYPERPMARPD